MKNTELTLPEELCEKPGAELIFRRSPTHDEWLQVGQFVHTAKFYANRWIADWRRVGRKNFGDEAVEQAEKSLHIQTEFKDLKAIDALEAIESRSTRLSDNQLISISKSLDGLDKARVEWQEKANYWQKVAEKEGLTPSELQKSIKAGEIVRENHEEKPRLNANDRSVGLVTIEGVHMQFNMWLRKVKEDDGFPEGWDARRLRMVRDLLAPIANIHREVSVKALEKGDK